MTKTLIIAEAGVNHNGSLALALQLVDAAVDAGVDIIKFQTFKAENLVTLAAEQAQYQRQNSQVVESQFSMLKKLELSFDEHLQVSQYCRKKGIAYLSTAFDGESLKFLVDIVGLKRLKIPSGELTNAPLLLEHAYTGHKLMISTGMATIDDIEQALGVIAFGFINDKNQAPNIENFKAAYQSTQGQSLLAQKVSLLHCTTEYPAPIAQINLNAMTLMSQHFSLPVGYSDHTHGILVPVAAVAKGACIIEKHFTLSRTMAGPDHKASLEPEELQRMVADIRQIEQALGRSIKEPAPCELKNISVARKSIVAKTAITKGEKYTNSNITILRPGSGISPLYFYDIQGTKANKDYGIGELITS